MRATATNRSSCATTCVWITSSTSPISTNQAKPLAKRNCTMQYVVGAIVILDEQTIADMKAKRARDKARDQARQEAEAIASGEVTDWKEAMKEWEAQTENQQ